MGAHESKPSDDGALENSSQNNNNIGGGDRLSLQDDQSNGGTAQRQKKSSKKQKNKTQVQRPDATDYDIGTNETSTPVHSTADLLAPNLSNFSSGGAVTGDISHLSSFTMVEASLEGYNSHKSFSTRYTPLPTSDSKNNLDTKMHHKLQQSSFGTSKMITPETGVDLCTLMVLKDYELNDGRNVISLRQGDALHLIGVDRTNTSYEVCMPDAISDTNATFYIPQNVVMRCRSLDSFPWYHGRVSRAEAERLLSSGIDGTFLVRESESSPGQLSVSLRSGQRVHHYRLTIDMCLWFLSPEWKFRTVAQLVRHHSRHPDGLACPLLYPAPKQSPQRTNTPPMTAPSQQGECWELNRADLRVLRRLGGGQYGDVYEAVLLSKNSKVAVKTLRLDCAMGEREFLEEANVMNALRHKNLVKLLGVVSRERPFYIVTEFMSHGNLQDFLRAKQSPSLTIVPVLLKFAVDVSAAMQYLESRSFIHRDLAARNCLVTEELPNREDMGFNATGNPEHLLVKVGDFGLARLVGGPAGKGAPSDAAYTANATGQFPIKWTAPEGLAYQRFSTKSDVWAFGILLWEIVTFGASPYPTVELSGVYALLERGYRMEKPTDCPDDVYQLMRDCWQWEPSERPTFVEICQRLSSILEQKNQVVPTSTDRFYEQLSTTVPQHQSSEPPPRPELSTFAGSSADSDERPRSSSFNSPSPGKTIFNNGNIARCRPHNFSYRQNNKTSPLKQREADRSASPLVAPKPSSAPPQKQPPSQNNGQNIRLAGNNGYGTHNPTVPPKPTDFSNSITAELAEQMRRRRAKAEQEQQVDEEKPQQQQATKRNEASSGGQHNNNTNNDASIKYSSATPSVAAVGKSVANNVNNKMGPVAVTTASTSQPSSTSLQKLISGDGRPVAPVKPCLRRLQNPIAATDSVEYSPTTAVVRPSTESTTSRNNSLPSNNANEQLQGMKILRQK